MIPKIFHRIWFGGRPRPVRYDDYWQEWQRLHPDWEFYTWTEENLPELANQAIYDDLPEWARSCGVQMSHERALAVQRADVVAYELVNRFGGVYLNCDMVPLKPFDDLLEHSAFLGMEDNYFVCNAVMGGEPDHPLYRDVIRLLPQNYAVHKTDGMEVATGPQHLTRVWRAGLNMYDVTVMPQSAFYPVHHGEVPYGTTEFGSFMDKAIALDSYACHMWGHRSQEGMLHR